MTDKLQEINFTNQKSESISSQKYLTFFIESQLYAIPSSHVVEIIRMQPITYMPKLPNFVKGVINLRGKIVPIVDLRLKFSKEECPYDDRTSIIVTDTNEMTVGLIVDMVNDVADISTNEISDAPQLTKATDKKYVCSIAKMEQKVAMLLDMEKIICDGQPGKKQSEDTQIDEVAE